MALTTEQLEEVLNYTAFQPYDAPQQEALRERLKHSDLEYLQIAILFSDDVNGGIIHNLAKESQDSDAAAIQLGKIIENINESINPDYGYSSTPIIKNLIGRLGSYDETIANDVKELTKQHVAIYNARVIAPTIDIPFTQQNNAARGTSSLYWLQTANRATSSRLLLVEIERSLNSDALFNAQERSNVDDIMNQGHAFFGGRQQNATNPDDLGARFERTQLQAVPNYEALQDCNCVLEREPDNVAALLRRATINENEESHGYDGVKQP
ncbi:MAG: hypothetical protein QM652_11265 [Legionella sp.]|uniref:hypothetical protein n=1 Tax=Legionella sp. TaxID=459 RepID=UPI0039E307B5